MRNGRHIRNRTHADARLLQRADSGFASGTGTLNEDVHFPHAGFLRDTRGILRGDLRGIRGCNLGIWRTDLVLANGYNEAFVGWGREDSELAVRLLNLGRRRLDLRGRALCYHLWHPPASRTTLAVNDELLATAQARRTTRCEQGLDQYLRTEGAPGSRGL